MNLPIKLTAYYGDSNDLYEVIIGGPTDITILKYRHGLDGLGSEVNYDDLSYSTQQGILRVIKHAIDNYKPNDRPQ